MVMLLPPRTAGAVQATLTVVLAAGFEVSTAVGADAMVAAMMESSGE